MGARQAVRTCLLTRCVTSASPPNRDTKEQCSQARCGSKGGITQQDPHTTQGPGGLTFTSRGQTKGCKGSSTRGMHSVGQSPNPSYGGLAAGCWQVSARWASVLRAMIGRPLALIHEGHKYTRVVPSNE